MTSFARIAALLVALPLWSIGVNLALAADKAPRLVEFESPLAGPQALQGLLRLPDGSGPSPAVVLLHGCGGGWRGIDERWGKLLAEWGYVTLTIDRFGTRGIRSACTGGLPIRCDDRTDCPSGQICCGAFDPKPDLAILRLRGLLRRFGIRKGASAP